MRLIQLVFSSKLEGEAPTTLACKCSANLFLL